MTLRPLLDRRHAVLVPGAPNALAARIIEALGFEAIYVTGAGVTNMMLGLPDLAFIDLTQIAQVTASIRGVSELPLIVDADTGFGNAINTGHAVRVLERSGANAIQLEDQLSPKRCGHFAGKAVVPAAEMAAKVRAAVDARRSSETLIVARTDARAVEGIEGALERAERYVEAGADVTFVEAPHSRDEMRRIVQQLEVPQLINLVVGGQTPILDQSELADMGFSITLYANVALQGAILGMRNALSALQKDGRMDESDLVASFAERQRYVDKDRFDELDRRYAAT
jgi:2-methylisocitrate lyase-like PEP mutase family enzyme